MVHEGFQASTGRTILVRVDDLPPNERGDVTQFFHAVQRLSLLDDQSAPLGWMGGLIVGVLAIIGFAFGLEPSNSGLLMMLVGSSVIGAISGGLIWLFNKGIASDQRVKLLAEVNVMFGRSERCRIAAEQLRQSSGYYARMLPAPASAS